MKLRVSKTELNTALSVVSRGVAQRSTLPILSGILLKTEGESLVLQSTNLDTSIDYRLGALIEEEGSTVVPSKLFADIVKSLPDAAIDISTHGNDAIVECESSRFTFRTMDAVDFPSFPEVDALQSISLPFNEFAPMVKKVARVVSKDESRAVLTGILISVSEGRLRLVATDSYRIALTEHHYENLETEFKAIISGAFLATVAGLPETEELITLSLSENQIRITYRQITFINRIIEGNYPNYQQLLPTDYTTRVVFDRSQLIQAIRRISLLSNNNAPIKFDINEATHSVQLFTLSQDVGEAVEDLHTEVEGESVAIGFNHSYILDGLNVLSSDTVVMEIQTPVKPGIFKSEEESYLYLVMPVRLSF